MRNLRWEIGPPVLVLLGLAAFAWLGWQNDVQAAHARVHAVDQILASVVGDRLREYLDERKNDLVSLRQARLAGSLSKQRQFFQRAEGLRANHPEFGTISFVDSRGTIVWSVGSEGRNHFAGRNSSSWPGRSELIEMSRESRGAVLSPLYDLISGGKGMGIYLSVWRGSRVEGFIVGGIDGTSLLMNAIPSAYRGAYNVALREGQVQLVVADATPRFAVGSVTSPALGRTFTIEVWPATFGRTSVRDTASPNALAGNLLMAILVSGILWAALRQRHAALQLADERRAAAEAHKASERRLADIVARSPWVIIEHGPTGLIENVNPATERVYKLRRDEMIGRSPAEWIHPDDLERTMEQIESTSSGGGLPVMENRNYDSAGHVHYMRWSGVQRYDNKGSVTGSISFGNDITVEVEAAAARERLLYEEQRLIERLWVLNDFARSLRTSLDRASLYRIAIRAVGNVLALRSCAILAYDGDRGELEIVETCGQPDPPVETENFRPGVRFALNDSELEMAVKESRQLVTPDLGAAVKPRDNALAAAGFVSRAAVPVLLDTHVAALLVTLSSNEEIPAAAPDEIEFIQGVAEHLALALTNARLFSDLRAAYTELREAQAQIVQMEKLRAVGEMASGVAHDFNNSLAAVMGYAELLEQEPLSNDGRFYAESIIKAAVDASATVRRIQSYSRHHFDTAFEPVDLNAIVRESVTLTMHKWRDQAQSRGVTIEVVPELDQDLPPALGSASELREVLTNLVFNAVDAMPEGGVITVRTSRQNGRAAVSVEDSGTGMPEEVRGRVFDPFFTTKGLDGSGLGLSVSYGIVRRHGGEIQVVSTPGHGSRFEILLPFAPQVARDAPVAPAASAGRCRRALVIDDDAGVSGVVSAILQKLGAEVVTAPDGKEGLARLREGEFDVVITDLGMPGMSGREVALGVREASPHTPIILLTGWGEQFRLTEDRPDAVDIVLGKPVRMEELKSALQRVCGNVPLDGAAGE